MKKIIIALGVIITSVTLYKASALTGVGEQQYPSLALFDKIATDRLENKSDVWRFEYQMQKQGLDTAAVVFDGAIYVAAGLKIDSNRFHYAFQNTKEYLALSFTTAMAGYANIANIKKEMRKNSNTQPDEMTSNLLEAAKELFQDSVLKLTVIKDNSYENANQIVLDMDFNEESPLEKYRLVYNKTTQLPDSLYIKYYQSSNELAIAAASEGASNEELSDEEIFANEYNEVPITNSYSAYNFTKVSSAAYDYIDQYITRSKKGIALKKHTNYSLTEIKY